MFSHFLAKLAEFILLAPAKIRGILLTIAAGKNAELGADCSVQDGGQIINIGNRRESIKIGDHARLCGEMLVFPDSGSIEVGEWFYLGPRSQIWSGDRQGIRIGNRVLVSSDVMIHDTNSHPLDAAERFEQTRQIFTSGHPRGPLHIKTSPISIGDDVWIGAHAMIARGVTIGARSIIGAHALVLSDVDADTIIPAGQTHRRVKT